MVEQANDIVLEHLKKIQVELAASKRRDEEMLSRFSAMEKHMARIGRDTAFNYEELIENRHVSDGLRARIERIERRLELTEI